MSLKEILKDAQGVPIGEYKNIAGGTMYADSPIGSILPYGGTTAPSGWFLCQGQAISRTTYAELFAVIGTAFGSGDGRTTFNIPDLREATVKGTGLTSKSNNHLDADGLTLGEFIDDRIQSHTHTYIDVHNGTNPSYGRADFTGSATEKYNFDGFTLTSSAPTGRSGITTEVKAVGVNYIIKAKMVALPADLDSAVDAKIAAKGVYSTSEVDTGKTWIDGKKIYRKVYNGTISASGQTLITASNVDSLVSYDGWYRVNTTCYKGWYDVQSGATWPVVTVSDHNLNLRFDSTGTPIASVQWVCCIVEYTKTT